MVFAHLWIVMILIQFLSIDRDGRYAFANQASIAGWNIARLAESLLKLISADEEEAY